jgi:hypothetical protein
MERLDMAARGTGSKTSIRMRLGGRRDLIREQSVSEV